MGALRRFLRRLQNAVAPGRGERELSREVDAHLGLLEDDYRAQGLSPEEARRAARIAIGGVEPAKDRHRDARSFVWLDDLRRDTAYAIRTLARSPGFAAVTILTLALSIGATTAILTVVDHVLVRALPLPDAGRLVRLYESNPSAGRLREDASPAHVMDWRRAVTTLDAIAAVGGTSVTMTGGAEPESLTAMTVGPEFFAITRASLVLGRPFDASEYESIANAALGPFGISEKPTTPASIIISHALWHRQFGGDPNVVGRRIALNGAPAVVAGVMPAGFWFDQPHASLAECWLPLVESRMSKQRRFRQFTVIGRLKPGVSLTAAQTELTSVAATMATQYPKDDAGWTVEVASLHDSLVAQSRPTLLILLGGVGCVLLIACANIAGLLLMRSASRAREVAVRMAIGAGRGRLVRQWLTESVVLALAGGLGGFLIAHWSVPLLVGSAPLTLPHLERIAVDGRIFVITMTLSVLTGLICGIAPALATRGITVANLRTTAAVGMPRHRWLRPALVIIQVGLAVVLLVGAGLMGRTLLAVRGLDLGFDPGHVLTFGVGLRGERYNSLQDNLNFGRDLVSRLEAVPVIEAAGGGMVPFVGGAAEDFIVEGHDSAIMAHVETPSPGYLRALKFRLRAGRFFTGQDAADQDPVAIVTAGFARDAWGTADVVGKRLRMDSGSKMPWMTVVGVIDDVRSSTLEAAQAPIVFVPNVQTRLVASSNFVVRTKEDARDALPIVRDLVRAIDPALAVTRVATMDERLAKFLAPRQFNVWLLGMFSLVALTLAVVGVYGLISEAVTSRTSEIGVRMALGATAADVVRLVAGTSLIVTAIGVMVGLGASAIATRSLGAMLYGVAPLDLVTMTTVPIVFIAAAALAALAPARRATRVDPVIALRGE